MTTERSFTPQNITDDLSACAYEPKAMMVVYQNSRRDTHLELHRILANGLPGASRPVTRTFINDMLEGFTKTGATQPHGRIPANLLFADARPGLERYVWWDKPRKRPQSFVPALGMEDGTYPFPGVVYAVKDDNLYVYAHTDRTVNENTRLYRGPFFNYYEDGRICLGNARTDLPPDPTWESLLGAWEKLFWGSTNSHLIGGTPIEGNLTTALKDARETGRFDTSLLLKTTLRVKDLFTK